MCIVTSIYQIFKMNASNLEKEKQPVPYIKMEKNEYGINKNSIIWTKS